MEDEALSKERELNGVETPRNRIDVRQEDLMDDKVEDVPVDHQAHVPSPPNGGLEAWLTVLACFCVFFNTWGVASTFGAFQAYYEADLLASESASAIAWIGSIQATLIVAVGTFVGPLFDRGYLKPLVLTGCFFTVFGMMMTSIATKYYQVFLAQGICTGFGQGLTYIPTLAAVATNFSTRRPIAIGISSLGSSFGGIIFPIMFRKIQPLSGFGWAVRSIAFINLGFAAVTVTVILRAKTVAHKPRSLLDLTAFRNINFVLFTLAEFFLFLAYYIPLFFVTSFARASLHTSDNFSFYLLAILNGSSFLGRTIPYLLGQKVKPVYVLLFWSTAGGILLFSWLAIHETAGFIIWCVLWGIVAGVLVTAPSSIIPHPVLSPSLEVVGTRLGMSWTAAAVGSLIGSPIAGALTNTQEASFLHAQIFAACSMITGAAFTVIPMIAITKYDRKKV